MQPVKLDILRQLIQSNGLHETDEDTDLGNSLTFSRLCKIYDDTKTGRMKSSSPEQRYDIVTKYFLDKYCPPIKFVGQGSSRTAFACIGGKCIKLAQTAAGKAQNRQEFKNTYKSDFQQDWPCFVYSYAHSDDYALLLTECCTPFADNYELSKAMGVDDLDIFECALFAVVKSRQCTCESIADFLENKVSLWRHGKFTKSEEKFLNTGDHLHSTIQTTLPTIEWLRSIVDHTKTLGQATFKQLLKYWQKNGIDELLPGDVSRYENWGYAVRDDKVWPVIIDAGFSAEVSDKFYS